MAKAAATARQRRSKADVQQDFLKIREQVAATREARNAKAEEAATLDEAEVRQAVDGLSVEGVAKSISALGIQISKALAAVSDDLIAEVQRLAIVREAVALERAELERLHKIDVAATALDQLVQDYDSKSQALEAEMSTRRATWEGELKARERAEREYDENVKKQRQRETEEYEYKKTIDRKKSQEKYDEDMRTIEKKNREKQEALEKSWEQRERTIKEREEEGIRLRQEVSGFPSRLQAETERALKLKDIRLVGINNRNLATFDVTLETTEKLRPMIPSEIAVVAESGIFTAGDVERLANAKVDAILVGEALVTSEDIGAKVRELSGRTLTLEHGVPSQKIDV